MGCGYAGQHGDRGVYFLTLKLTSLGLDDHGRFSVVDVAEPFLDRLATESEGPVRLAVVDREHRTVLEPPPASASVLLRAASFAGARGDVPATSWHPITNDGCRVAGLGVVSR